MTLPARPTLGYGFFLFSPAKGTFEQLDLTWSYRWKSMERIGRRPAHQYLGPGMDKVTIKGTWYPLEQDTAWRMDQLQIQSRLGLPLPLYKFNGRIYGLFVMTNLKATETKLYPNGIPAKISFTMTLEKYGLDGLWGALS